MKTKNRRSVKGKHLIRFQSKSSVFTGHRTHETNVVITRLDFFKPCGTKVSILWVSLTLFRVA